MNIQDFLTEARKRTEAAESAADLRRKLRNLPVRYRTEHAARETAAGYAVGEQRLTKLRNEAALATIRCDPGYKEKIAALIVVYSDEARVALGNAQRVRSTDRGAETSVFARFFAPAYSENVGGRVRAVRWAETAQNVG